MRKVVSIQFGPATQSIGAYGLAVCAVIFGAAEWLSANERTDGPSFTREVRPILSRYCFKCHGPDEETREGGLRLDARESAIQAADSGLAAIVPHQPDMSELIARITSDDEFTRMPPPSTKTALTVDEKKILADWVEAGAPYEPHWSFIAPQQAELPTVQHKDWPRNAIDHFILARLEKEGLSPSAEADRRTLIRRVSLDLIGLPPTPEEVDAFLADESSDAYERLVDRLLASPHYGERWARRWLDLARYADTNGYEKDRPRTIWPYRDWVIDALNRDMPFDEFTIAQLAGDLLLDATQADRVATGFHRNTMLNEEGGIDPQEYRFYSLVDRVATTGTTWLGLTTGCAQCHTHKYDPLTHHDYFRLMAFFNNADEPQLSLTDEDFERRSKEHSAKVAEFIASLPDRFPANEYEWHPIKPNVISTQPHDRPQFESEAIISFPAGGPERIDCTLEFPPVPQTITHLRLEVLPDDKLPRKGPGRAPNGNFVLSEFQVSLTPAGRNAAAQPIAIASAQADFSQDNYLIEHAIDGKRETGWAIDGPGRPDGVTRTAIFTLSQPVDLAQIRHWSVSLQQAHGQHHTLGRIRLSYGTQTPSDASPEERRTEAMQQAFQKWLAEQREKLVHWQIVRPETATSGSPYLTILDDDSVLAAGDMTKRDEYVLTFQDLPAAVRAFRIEVLPDERLPAGGPGRVFYEGRAGDFFLSEITWEQASQPWAIREAHATYDVPKFTIDKTLDRDPQTGWSITGAQGERNVAVYVLAEPTTSPEATLRLLFERYYASGLGRFRVSVTTDQPDSWLASSFSVDVERLLAKDESAWSATDRALMQETFLLTSPLMKSAQEELDKLRRAAPKPNSTLVFEERPADHPRQTFVHHRGEFLSPTDEVKANVPAFLPPLADDAEANRLTFARWLVAPDHPLTARVAVNRQWAAIFGAGLVKTVEDFGLQGEAPSHPELLDWLAVQFVRDGWSLKQLHRMMVTSAAYRQSSRVKPDLLKVDSENRLLARGPRGRLDAEQIRDSILKVSGLLTSRIGGPSVYPPQPASVTNEGTFGRFDWPTSQGPDRYRRTLYTFSKRTAPFAFAVTFDAPSGEACVARRDVSNTALQALNLLNDPMFLEAAQALGREYAGKSGSVQERIAELFQQCLTRPADESELDAMQEFFTKQHQLFSTGKLDPRPLVGKTSMQPADEAAWTALARVILNLDEMMTRR
jgi:hypothetical protein